MTVDIVGMVTLFTAYGTCQKPGDSCEGGTPDNFNLADLIPESLSGVLGGAGMLSGLLGTPSANADCETDLVCCINNDQCDGVGDQLLSAPMIGGLLAGSNISCQSAGSCSGASGTTPTELALGCPEGQTCCIVLPEITIPDGGLPTIDGGTPTGDGGN